MLKYELKKYVFRKEIVILTVCFLIFNTLNIIKNNYNSDSDYNVYRDVYSTINEHNPEKCIEKIRKLDYSDRENSYQYGVITQEMVNELASFPEYGHLSDAVMNQCYDKAEMNKNNEFLFRMNVRLGKRFADRELTRFYNVNKIPELINYRVHFVLIIFLIIFGAAGIFAGEKEANIEMLVKTSRKGFSTTVFNKIIALFILVTGETLLFFADNMLSFYACYKFDGLGMPVYQIFDYRGAVFNTASTDTIIIFLIKMYLLSIVALVVIGLFVLLFSALFKTGKIAFFAGIALLCLMIYYRACHYIGYGQVANVINPVSGFSASNWMLYYKNANIGGTPVYYVSLYLSAMLLECIILIFSIRMVYVGVFRKNGKSNKK